MDEEKEQFTILDEERDQDFIYSWWGERTSMNEEREPATIMDEEREQAIICNEWGERTSYYNG